MFGELSTFKNGLGAPSASLSLFARQEAEGVVDEALHVETLQRAADDAKQQEQRKATTATVTSVVDLSENDSTGAGLTVASFPLVLAGMISGIMMLTLVQGL